MSRNAVNRYFEGFLVGGALGFIAGLLTAPKPGSELRRELADGADDLLTQVNTQLTDLSEVVSEKVQPIADRAAVLKEQMAERAADMGNKVASQTGVIREKVSDTAQEMRDKAIELKTQAMEKAEQLKSQAKYLGEQASARASKMQASFDASVEPKPAGATNQQLMDNYMGNNSGPMYTPGVKADTESSASSVSDPHSSYSANKPEAAGG